MQSNRQIQAGYVEAQLGGYPRVLSCEPLEILAGAGGPAPDIVQRAAGYPVPALQLLGNENGFEVISGPHISVFSFREGLQRGTPLGTRG
jgi:hypothetical protein